MRRRRNADEVARSLRQADRDLATGLTVGDVCRGSNRGGVIGVIGVSVRREKARIFSNRGNNRADVFCDEGDRIAFLEGLAKAKDRYPLRSSAAA